MANEGTYAYAAPMPDNPFIPQQPRPAIELQPIQWTYTASDPVTLEALGKLKVDVAELVQMNKTLLLAAESILLAMGVEDVKAGRVSKVPRKTLAPKRSKRRPAKKGGR